MNKYAVCVTVEYTFEVDAEDTQRAEILASEQYEDFNYNATIEHIETETIETTCDECDTTYGPPEFFSADCPHKES